MSGQKRSEGILFITANYQVVLSRAEVRGGGGLLLQCFILSINYS